MNSTPLTKYLLLGLGIAAVSSAAILIRLTTAPAPVIAFYRLGFAALLLLPAALHNKQQLKKAWNPDYLLPLIGGSLFLAAHFLLWIASLDHTTVASSVVFVATQPIFVTLGSYFIFKEQISPKLILGIGLAISGSIVIGISDLKLAGNFLYGDLLALGGAVMIAGYVLIAGRLRQKLALFPYVFLVYLFTACFLLFFVLLTNYSLVGYQTADYLIFLALAVGPNIIGHTTINWSLKYISPPVVAASILGEPIGSTVLAFLILGEVPPLATLAGGAVILTGIYFAAQSDYENQISQ